MTKKEFTKLIPKEFNDLSDIELIEKLSDPLRPTSERDTIKAILDKKTKKVLQYLTEVVQKSSEITDNFNKKLVGLTTALVRLTIVIVVLTVFMLIGLGIQIWLNIK